MRFPSGVRAYAEREMRDRATIERNQAEDDPFGGEGTPDWQVHLTDQKCKLWIQAGREAVSETRTLVVEDWQLAVPLGTDIVEGDRITTVTADDRTITSDILYVEHVADKRAQLVCSLERRN